MDQKQRHKRLRLLISKLNKERKKQVKKIDMLCNDLIAAQRDFIKKLNTISFAADFYRSIIGITDLDRLLSTAGKLIKDELADTDVTFFLRNGFPRSGNEQRATSNVGRKIENYFTAELVENICKSNKLCTLDDMYAMGLQGNLVELTKITAAAVPLSQLGPPVGLILIYRSSENKSIDPAPDVLTADELNKISAITNGLTQAIQSCQAPLHIKG